MKLKLTKRSKIWLEAGETVDVSPADADFLIAVGAAVPVNEPTAEQAEEKPAKKAKK